MSACASCSGCLCLVFTNRLSCLPLQMRSDGVSGQLVRERTAMIRALPPMVMDVTVSIVRTGPMHAQGLLSDKIGSPSKPAVGGAVRGTAKYRGGSEGQSIYKWQRQITDGGQWTDIPGASRQTYTLADDDAGARLRFCLLPVNIDGVQGEWAYSAALEPVVSQSPSSAQSLDASDPKGDGSSGSK